MSQATHPKPQRGTTRMFESDFFEKFSRVHPWIPAVLYLPVVAISAFIASQSYGVAPGRLLLQVFGGYLAWTLFEYWAHRLVFHMPVVGPKTKRIQFLIHGVHHDFPWDEMRLVFPPGASIGLCVVTYAVFRGIFGVDGMYGPFLALAESCEQDDGNSAALADALFMSAEQVNRAHLSALAWAQNLKL